MLDVWKNEKNTSVLIFYFNLLRQILSWNFENVSQTQEYSEHNLCYPHLYLYVIYNFLLFRIGPVFA